MLLEDPDTVSILDMVKEKLSGQMVAGLLEGSRQGAVRVCLTSLNRLLNIATKKRSDDISSLITVNRGQMKTGTKTQQEEEAEATAASLLPCTTDEHDNHYNKEANYQSAEEETAPDAKAQEDDEGGHHDDAQTEENCQGSE